MVPQVLHQEVKEGQKEVIAVGAYRTRGLLVAGSRVYYIRVVPNTTSTATYNENRDGTSTCYCDCDWDYDYSDWYWRPAQVPALQALPQPFPAYEWPYQKRILAPDVNALWRRPMRHFYKLHEEKRKGLRR